MRSPLEQSYVEPFRHPAFHYTPDPTPAERWATRQAESRARATERRVALRGHRAAHQTRGPTMTNPTDALRALADEREAALQARRQAILSQGAGP